MASVQGSCPVCGPVPLAPWAVHLRLRGDGAGSERYVCPACRAAVIRPAAVPRAAALTRAGAVVDPGPDGIARLPRTRSPLPPVARP